MRPHGRARGAGSEAEEVGEELLRSVGDLPSSK